MKNLSNLIIASLTAALIAACANTTSGIDGGLIPGMQLLDHAGTSTSGAFTVLHRFQGLDGADPMGTLLIDGTGKIYGTTFSGGASGNGALFSLTPHAKGYSFRVLHSFNGNDGANPQSGVLLVSGILYGTTYAGGAHKLGTVFAFSTFNGSFKTIYSFAGGQDGQWPKAGLVWHKGALFGTTFKGGYPSRCGKGCGTVFRITPSGSETILHRFGGTDYGSGPSAALLDADSGDMFGTTITGGPPSDCRYGLFLSGCGTVFEMTRSAGKYSAKIIYRFPGDSYPYALTPNGPMIADGQRNLYGTTEWSGGNFHYGGTVFMLSPSGSGYVESTFCNLADGGGGNEATGQIVDLNGTIYGTTVVGSSGWGNIYATPGGLATEVYRFTGGPDGAFPYGGLTYANGYLYGTAQQGGGCSSVSGGCGTIFRLRMTGQQ